MQRRLGLCALRGGYGLRECERVPWAGVQSTPAVAEIFKVPMIGSPLVASRPEPVRAARVPERVRQSIVTMVETGASFVDAGKQHGVSAQMMRRWLGRTEAIHFLRKTRAQFRAAACAGNEHFLVAIRSGDNSMAAVNAIKVLEQISDGEIARPSTAPTPGITLVIHQPAAAPIVDITPSKVIDAGD